VAFGGVALVRADRLTKLYEFGELDKVMTS